jgi:hypothetical protein
LDSDVGYEIVDHAHAIVFVVACYLTENKLPVDKRLRLLKWHMKRLNLLLGTVAYPLERNPIEKRLEPNEMLQQEMQGLPNVDVTLPHVTIFISNCYLW